MPQPINEAQLLILQNIFDTQPKMRAAYFNKLGYVMNPKDDNEYKPIGSTGPYLEVDPGWIKAYQKDGLAGLWNEAGQKAEQNIGTAITGGAASFGAQLAGSKMPGPPVLKLMAALLGGVAGAGAAEGIKTGAAELLLDKAMPVEMGPFAVQALVNGVAPKIAELGIGGAKAAYAALANKARQSILTAATKFGNGVTPKMLDFAAEHMDDFTPKAVEGANARMEDLYKGIFGIAEGATKKPNSASHGMFGPIMENLAERKDIALQGLAKNPQANFTAGELLSPIQNQMNALAQKEFMTPAEEAAYSALKSQKDKLLQKIKPTKANNAFGYADTPSPETPIDFKTAREFMEQGRAAAYPESFGSDPTVKNEFQSILRQAYGGGEDQMNGILKQKAASAGSDYGNILDQQSKVLDVYSKLKEQVGPKGQNLTKMILSNDAPGMQDLAFNVKNMDQILGSDLSSQLETGAFQSAVEKWYTQPKAFGSGLVNAAAVEGAAKGTAVGGASGAAIAGKLGLPAAVGAGIGGPIGAATGAANAVKYANPQTVIEALGRTANGSTGNALVDSVANVASTPMGEGLAHLGVQAGANKLGQALSPTTPDVNPFLAGLDEQPAQAQSSGPNPFLEGL